MRDLDYIKNMMEAALVNIDHPSRIEHTESQLRRLKEELDEYFHPPADLGIRVGEVISTGDVFGE